MRRRQCETAVVVLECTACDISRRSYLIYAGELVSAARIPKFSRNHGLYEWLHFLSILARHVRKPAISSHWIVGVDENGIPDVGVD